MVSFSPMRMSSSSATVAGIVEVMMGFANVWSNGSMVFALVTHGLLARPRPCELHMLPAFNARRMSSATGVNSQRDQLALNAGGPPLEAYIRLCSTAYVTRHKPRGGTRSLLEQGAVARSTCIRGSFGPRLVGVRKRLREVLVLA